MQLFALLGSACVKAVHKQVDEIDPRYLEHLQCEKFLSIFDSKMFFLPASSVQAEALTMDLKIKKKKTILIFLQKIYIRLSNNK